MAGRSDSPAWADIENLLGKPTASKEVAHFVEANHLNIHSATNITVFENVKESPFVLVCDNNVVDEVAVALWKYEFMNVQPYMQKIAHGIRGGDTLDTVVQSLGQPTRQAFHHGVIDAYYPKLRLCFGFDEKSRCLQSVVIYKEGVAPRSRLLQ
jgi:hypothetical protein